MASEQTDPMYGIDVPTPCTAFPNQPKKLLEAAPRFWVKVDKAGPIHPVLQTRCWLWTGNKKTKGKFLCGWLTVKSKLWYAHRFSWALHNGDIPANMWVLHKCDNPLCVNPTHLFLGDVQANQADMVAKERQAMGERHWAAVATEDLVKMIRGRYKPRCPVNGAHALAAETGLSYSIVNGIVRGVTWQHVRV